MRPTALVLFGVVASTPAQANEASMAAQAGTDRVTITQVSDDPAFGSGVLAVAVKVSGTTIIGEQSYFIPFMTIGQAKPHAGEVCEIAWKWFPGDFDWMLASGEQIRSGRMVETFRCEPKRS